MTSKQKRRSALRASRTDAMRRSMGSMCKSSRCFQLLYSDTLPASRTIQNLSTSVPFHENDITELTYARLACSALVGPHGYQAYLEPIAALPYAECHWYLTPGCGPSLRGPESP